MANKIPVKFYFNTMPGMPQITNEYGDTVKVLDYVLVNGGPHVGVTGITFADGIATVTCPAHGYMVEQVIEILGAEQDEYNGEWRVTQVTTNTFKYAVAVAPSAIAATGALKTRIPPLGYEIAFTGTNKRVYRSKDPLATRPYLRVDNSLHPNWNAAYNIVVRVTAAAVMTDIDTFGDGRMPFDPVNPTMNETVSGTGGTAQNGWFWWHQSGLGFAGLSYGKGTAANRDWSIVGDSRAFYYSIQPFSSYDVNAAGTCNYGFGEYDSLKKDDPYNYFMIATEWRGNAGLTGAFPGTYHDITCGNLVSAYMGMILPKSYLGIGEYTNYSLHHMQYRVNLTLSNRGNSIPMPNGPDMSVRFATRAICDVVRGDHRGEQPGQFFVLQATPFSHRNIIKDVSIDGSSVKRNFLTLRSAYSGNQAGEPNLLAYDITGPWRK